LGFFEPSIQVVSHTPEGLWEWSNYQELQEIFTTSNFLAVRRTLHRFEIGLRQQQMPDFNPAPLTGDRTVCNLAPFGPSEVQPDEHAQERPSLSQLPL
jgi:hypothetical protein